MGPVIVIVVIALAALAFYTFSYPFKVRNQIDSKWKDIEGLLTRRRETIPQLISAIQSFTEVTQDLSDVVSDMRAQITEEKASPELRERESEISRHVRALLALGEANSGLKMDPAFAGLRSRVAGTEGQLHLAIQDYNEKVRYFNNLIDSFPISLVADRLDLEQERTFQMEYAAAIQTDR